MFIRFRLSILGLHVFYANPFSFFISSSGFQVYLAMTPSGGEEEAISGQELESILSSRNLPFWKRVRPATAIELKLLFHLAGPAVVVYMINYVMSMSTQIFSGHLGNFELAAASLGNTGIQLFAYTSPRRENDVDRHVSSPISIRFIYLFFFSLVILFIIENNLLLLSLIY